MSPNVPDLLERWASLWAAPELMECNLRVNRRLKRSLGLCRPGKQLIDINPLLLGPGNEALLEETICHEFAHYVVFSNLGRSARPHGREWQILMRAAGHTPRPAVPTDEITGAVPPTQRARYEYVHRCPRCDATKVSRRTSHRWRCAQCVGDGYEGYLDVTRHRLG